MDLFESRFKETVKGKLGIQENQNTKWKYNVKKYC